MKMLDLYTLSPQDKHNILLEYLQEKELRESNPALMSAWQQYKTLLALVDKNTPPDPIDETQFG